MAVAVFKHPAIHGEAIAISEGSGIRIHVEFTKLPSGKHGFHIHKAGDLRGDGCKGACEHWHVGPSCNHGGRPRQNDSRERHTGDLGNIELKGDKARYSYFLEGVTPGDLWGRALIIHADEDDLGRARLKIVIQPDIPVHVSDAPYSEGSCVRTYR